MLSGAFGIGIPERECIEVGPCHISSVAQQEAAAIEHAFVATAFSIANSRVIDNDKVVQFVKRSM